MQLVFVSTHFHSFIVMMHTGKRQRIIEILT